MKGIIYGIINLKTGLLFIDSVTTELKERIELHIRGYKSWKNKEKGSRFYKSYSIFEECTNADDWDIIVYSEKEYETRELLKEDLEKIKLQEGIDIVQTKITEEKRRNKKEYFGGVRWNHGI